MEASHVLQPLLPSICWTRTPPAYWQAPFDDEAIAIELVGVTINRFHIAGSSSFECIEPFVDLPLELLDLEGLRPEQCRGRPPRNQPPSASRRPRLTISPTDRGIGQIRFEARILGCPSP